MLFKTDQLSM